MQEIDETVRVPDFGHFFGTSVYTTGVPADGSCLVHSFFYVTDMEYRKKCQTCRTSLVTEFRERMADVDKKVLENSGYDTCNLERVRAELRHEGGYLDNNALQLIMYMTKYNIVVLDQNTAEIVCHQSKIAGEDDKIERLNDPLVDKERECVLLYLIGRNHYQPIFIKKECGDSRYVFSYYSEAMKTLRSRYLKCCSEDGYNSGNCHMRDNNDYQSRAISQNKNTELGTMSFFDLQRLAVSIGVDIDTCSSFSSECLRPMLEHAIVTKLGTKRSCTSRSCP